ncbi:MAG TPA: histidine phosphatase family protein [Symbiobacteriaceae bacterium]|nr:histidine phosphatase family protein [Symbiobacteriaceae bacterium]
MIRLLVCRHGESTADLDPCCIEGSADFPLTDRGRRQAAALGAWVAARYRVSQILTSPLLRARQTAEAVAAATGVPFRLEQRLAERSTGRLAGLLPEEADRLFPTEHPLPMHHRPPGGESYLDLYRRVAELWSLLSWDQRLDGQTLLLLTHGGAGQAFMRAALGLPPGSPAAFAAADTGLHELHCEPRGSVRLVKFNYTLHLEGLE